MRRIKSTLLPTLAVAIAVAGCDRDNSSTGLRPALDDASTSETSFNPATLNDGKRIFRFDTFGDETFWTDTLRMHEVIRTGVSPAIALSVGLKVDVNALPAEVKAGILNNSIDINAPATTVVLLKLGA